MKRPVELDVALPAGMTERPLQCSPAVLTMRMHRGGEGGARHGRTLSGADGIINREFRVLHRSNGEFLQEAAERTEANLTTDGHRFTQIRLGIRTSEPASESAYGWTPALVNRCPSVFICGWSNPVPNCPEARTQSPRRNRRGYTAGLVPISACHGVAHAKPGALVVNRSEFRVPSFGFRVDDRAGKGAHEARP
jgi:hypothetical protein